MNARNLKIQNGERGQVLILAALAIPLLLGFLGLAVDVGLLFRAKRNLQIAADAAAMGAAMDYLYNGSVPSAQAAGKADATSNGFTNGVNGVSVPPPNCPPSSGGPNAGRAGFCEAIITQRNPVIFMALFNTTSVTVGARAVAGPAANSKGCLYVLDPSANKALDLQGSFNFTVSNCGVIVDSNSSSALNFTGGSGTFTAASISVVGGASGQISDSNVVPVTGVAPISDPLRITGPTPTNGLCTSTSTATSLTGTIASPPGGVVCYSKAVTMTNVTLGTGTYVFENGVTLGGNITSGTGGTTLDIESGSLSVNTGTVLNLVAPTSGTYNGIALMEPASNTSTILIQKGDSSGSLTGIIYAPGAELFLQDSGGGTSSSGVSFSTDLIVGTFLDKTDTVTINSYSQSNTTSPLKAVTLVE